MSETQKCSQCLDQFTIDKLPHQLKCGHNICHPCLVEINQEMGRVIFCQFCQKTINHLTSTHLPFNQQTPLFIQEKAESLSSPIAHQSHENLLNQHPLFTSPHQHEEICPTHQILMDIICTTDRQKICPHCALFGQHQKHSFKRIDDFQTELDQQCQLFNEIMSQKAGNNLTCLSTSPINLLHERVLQKKQEALNELSVTIRRHMQLLKVIQSKLSQQIQQYFTGIQKTLPSSPIFQEWQSSKNRFEVWQKRCESNIQKMSNTGSLEEKINVYFNQPLEMISDGYILMEELNRRNQIVLQEIKEVTGVKIFVKELAGLVEEGIKVCTPNIKGACDVKSEVFMGEDQINLFLDCTSSQISINGKSLIHNNVSIQDQICSLANSVKFIPNNFRSPKLTASQKHCMPVNNVHKQKISPVKKKGIVSHKQLKQSKNIQIKSSKTIPKTMLLRPVVLQVQAKDFDPSIPDQRIADFMKSTLTDFLDLSDCHLQNGNVFEYVSKARKHHKVKGLKLCSNYIDSSGFQRVLHFLKGVSNINLANNQISQSIFDLLIKNKDKLEVLRVINLTHNPINLDNKSKNKLEQIRRTGIIVTL